MAKLILVRHANTKPSANAPDHDWPLTPEGLQRSKLVANALRPFEIKVVFTSKMSRAVKTGETIANELGLAQPQALAAFNENDRTGMPFYEAIEDFRKAIANFLIEKDKVVMGLESAETALTRFKIGVDDIRAQHADNVAIVSHGTVMALFLAHCSGQSSIEMWHELQSLGMPNYVILDMDTLQILEKYAV